jgi:hypothetical protein
MASTAGNTLAALLRADSFALFALASKHALAKIANPGPHQSQLSQQISLAFVSSFLELANYAPKALVAPLLAPHRPRVQALPVIGLHYQLDVLRLG